MAPPTNDIAQLLIRCPSCGQRFRVGMDLRDRTVECGACEHRFRINDDVIVRSKKVYPGERTDSLANRYHRVPIAAPMPEGLQTAQYADAADASAFEPISPLRLIAGGGAAVGVILMAMLLFFGAANGGALDGMPTTNRMVMGGFTAAIATALFIYANPKARFKAVVTAACSAALLLGLPLFRTEGAEAAIEIPKGDTTAKLHPIKRSGDMDPVEKLRAIIGTDPLTAEQKALEDKNSPKHAYGLWLRGLGDGEKLLVRDYLIRTVGADLSTHAYPRGTGEYLMVVTGLDITLQKLSECVAPIGEVANIYQEVDVIEVLVKADNFRIEPLEKLSDRGSPEFYALNKRELESIDLDRVKGAVERLTDAAPKEYRSDITRRLADLLNEAGVDFKPQVCDALQRWSDGSATKVGDAAEALLTKLNAAKSAIPPELIALLVKEKRVSIIPILERLWLEDVSQWERYLVDLGPPAEATIIERFPKLTGSFRNSAIRVLGKVGGRDSLELIKSARQGATGELLVGIETAEKEIRKRLGE